MTSSYPSATGRSHLPGHSAPSMPTPAAGDEHSRLRENPNAQVDFIKTLPRKDVAFGSQVAMDRDRLPLVAKHEQFADSISAGTSTATMLKEKQISTYDTQVAAHAPTVTSSSSTNANIGSPSSSTRPHLIPDTVINMANKAKEMIFGHKHETTTTTTGAYSDMPITTPIPGVSMTSPPLPSSTIASRTEPTTKEKAEEMMGVVQLPGEKTTTPLAKFNTTSTGPTTLDKIKNTIATDTDKAKHVLTNNTEKMKQTISSGTEKAKQIMEKEKAAISSGAHQLADKTKEMLGMDTTKTKTFTKTSLKREDDTDIDTTLLAQQDFLEPALQRKMSGDKTKTTFPMTGTNTSILPLEQKPLETLVKQQDVLEPELFVESAPVSRVSTTLSMEKESTSKMTEKSNLFGTKLEESGRHSPNLIDQIATDNPFAIGAEVEDQMAMFMAQRLRSHK